MRHEECVELSGADMIEAIYEWAEKRGVNLPKGARVSPTSVVRITWLVKEDK